MLVSLTNLTLIPILRLFLAELRLLLRPQTFRTSSLKSGTIRELPLPWLSALPRPHSLTRSFDKHSPRPFSVPGIMNTTVDSGPISCSGGGSPGRGNPGRLPGGRGTQDES